MTTKKVSNWTITAESFSEPSVLIDLESPCGNFGCSLACAEDTGIAEAYDSEIWTQKRIPAAVIKAAQKLEAAFLNTRH